MTNKKEVLKRLLMMAEYFKENLSTNQQELYLMALNRFEDEDILRAIDKLMFNRYFPRLIDFKEFIEGTQEDQAIEAWEHVLKEISRVGCKNAKFDEATTNAINAIGGIEAIGILDRDKLSFKMKEFLKCYNITQKRVENEAIGSKKILELTNKLADRLAISEGSK